MYMQTINLTKNAKKQKGSTLIEALVSVLLVGIMSAGTIGVSARVALVQATGAQQQIAINQMSNLLRSGVSLCNGTNPKNVDLPIIPNITAADLKLQISGCEANTASTLAGTAINGARKNVVLTLQRKVGGEFTDFVKVGS
jgi:type II secretory pathway pseudopilin PulG